MGRAKGAAAVLSTAPAYTFGSGSHSFGAVNDSGPGPGAYPVKVTGSEHGNLAKGGGFGTGGRLARYGNDNPAPGEYNVSLKATHKSSRETLVRGRESPDLMKHRQPGPGQYADVPSSVTHPDSPKISVGHRLVESKEAERKPGPGEYSPDNYRSTSPLPITIKHKRGLDAGDRPDSGHAVPGPGAYRPQDVTVNSRHSPAHVMGGSRRSPSKSHDMPGPADYSPYLEKPKGAASFDRSDRSPTSHYEIRPDPGSYFTHNVVQRQAGHAVDSYRRSAPTVTIGVRDPPGFTSSTPGPSDYGVPKEELLHPHSPKYTFKGVAAKDHLGKNPGPGHYSPEQHTEVNSVHSSAPTVSISHRHPEPSSQERKPAPGEYNPESYSPKSPLAVTIKHKRGLAAADRPDSGHAVPGPGQYKLPSTLKGPAITMGQKLNSDSKYKQQQPGPGNYECTRVQLVWQADHSSGLVP